MSKQDLIVILAVVAVLGIVVVAVVVTSGEDTVTSGGTFRARPGTMRDTVQPIVSAKQQRTSPGSSGSGDGGGSEGAPEDLTIVVHESAVAKAMEQAVNAPSPEDGVQQLRDYLAGPHDPAEDSRLYSTMATVTLRVVPADPEAAAEAADEAMALAQSPEDFHSAAYAKAMVLESTGQLEDARTSIRMIREKEPGATIPGLKLGVLEAMLDERAEDTAAAEATYGRVMNEALSLSESDGEKALEHYRVAALRLARLYRSTGREKEAENLARQAQRVLQ